MHAEIEARGENTIIILPNGRSLTIHKDGSWLLDNGSAVTCDDRPAWQVLHDLATPETAPVNRVYRVDRSRTTEAANVPEISAAHPDFPEVGRQVLQILERLGVRKDTLSVSQIRQLRDIPVASTKQPRSYLPPESERKTNPALWDQWIGNIEKHPAYKVHFVENRKRPTAGNVIDIIRGYEWLGGWVTFKDKQRKVELEEHPGWQ